MARKVVHVGLDGGSFQVLDDLARGGLLPEYAGIKERGGWSVLRSTTPWFTVPAWITWMTGVSAERHGRIYWTASAANDHWDRRAGASRLVSLNDVPYPTLFRIASEAGARVASINMPVTFPPEQINGVMVSGFLAPDDPERTTHPSGFLRTYPAYRVDLEGAPETGPPSLRTDEEVERQADLLAGMARERHRVAMDLIGSGYDFTSVVYVGTDRLSHVAWPQVAAVRSRPASSRGERAVEGYYREIDRILGESLRAAEGALFVVTSDHGQGPPPERIFAPNVWLRDRGWLVTTAAGVRVAARAMVPARFRRSLWRLYRRARTVPSGSSPFVDWDRTRAYAVEMAHCRAFGIALRDPNDDATALVDELLGLTDPGSGERLVKDVQLRDTICSETGAETYPDLVVILNERFGATKALDVAMLDDERPGPSGYHEAGGILLGVGAEVTAGAHPEASIEDVAPTVLATLGVRPPDQMRGRVIDWLTPVGQPLRGVDVQGTTSTEEELSSDDESRIAEHLRSLGYID